MTDVLFPVSTELTNLTNINGLYCSYCTNIFFLVSSRGNVVFSNFKREDYFYFYSKVVSGVSRAIFSFTAKCGYNFCHQLTSWAFF